MNNLSIAVDVGGTKIYIGLVNTDTGDIVEYYHFFKDDLTSDQVLNKINEQISLIMTKHGEHLPVGIAVPELVDNQQKIQSSYNYHWQGKEHLFTGSKVIIESDVRAAALTELTFGAAKNSSSSIYISMGTGISYCFIQDGQIWRGYTGSAIHFATSDLYFSYPPQSFNYEQEISGKALDKLSKSMFHDQATTKDIFEKLKQKDKNALIFAQSHALLFGGLIAQLVNILDPENVIIGGGLGIAMKNSIYAEMLQTVIQDHIIAKQNQNIPILWAHYESFSALIGAGLSTR